MVLASEQVSDGYSSYADAGYRAIVLTDGTSTINDEGHNAGLNYVLENIAERVTCAEAAAALGG